MVRQQKSLKLPTKRKLQFKRKYPESYLNYGFIATGDSHSLSPLYTICGDWLSNEAMKSSQLLCPFPFHIYQFHLKQWKLQFQKDYTGEVLFQTVCCALLLQYRLHLPQGNIV